MLNIRTNVFETNSSSLHSIIITPSTDNDRTYSLDNDRTAVAYDCINNKVHTSGWRFYNGEFGRSPFEILREPKDKMLYAMADGVITVQEAYEMAKKHEPEVQFFELTVETYKKLENVVIIYLYDGEKWFKRKMYHDAWKKAKPLKHYGSVDHQSSGMLESFLKKKNITVDDFVYGNQYTIIIDGDEYDFIGMLESLGYEAKEGMEVYYG